MNFRKKPVVIQAEQYRAELDRLPFSGDGDPVEYDEDEHRPYVQSLEGKHWVSDGDWIIRGVKGEFYACKPDIFAMTYEAASTPAYVARPDPATCDHEFEDHCIKCGMMAHEWANARHTD